MIYLHYLLAQFSLRLCTDRRVCIIISFFFSLGPSDRKKPSYSVSCQGEKVKNWDPPLGKVKLVSLRKAEVKWASTSVPQCISVSFASNPSLPFIVLAPLGGSIKLKCHIMLRVLMLRPIKIQQSPKTCLLLSFYGERKKNTEASYIWYLWSNTARVANLRSTI